jgi:alanine-glyoxylate transaminase/serine-glyoxylate transaminase/serine-pyruvate transaminase
VPFTPPVSLIRGQRVALAMLESEGYESVFGRVATLAHASRQAFKAMGLKLCSSSPSDSVTGAFYPELTPAIEDKKFRAGTRDNFGIHLAGGQDGRGAMWEGKTFRISHMGYVDAGDTLACLQAVEAELIKAGHKVAKGTAVSEAVKHL